jgi:phosphatidylserine decarboxylase
MVKDGLFYGSALGLVAATLGWLLNPWAALPFLAVGGFCLYFFRDPDRESPAGPVAVSPADGKVVEIRPVEGGAQRVSIFLNVFDVHVNRCPVGGVITEVRYTPGKFKVASVEAASAENEQNTLTVDDGRSKVVFKQIAGLVARRIVCRKKVGDRVQTGERFGLIKFGSRMDVILGPEWELAVRRGERVKGGSSILARRRETSEGRQ